MKVNFFELEEKLIKILWFWPSAEFMSWKTFIKVAITSVMMLLPVTGEISFALRNVDQLPIALNALGPVASKLMVLSKVLVLYYYRVDVMECLAIFKRRMERELNKSSDRKPFIRNMRIANLISKVLAINIIITCIYYMMLPITQILIGEFTNQPYEKNTPFKMWFPAPFNTNKSPTYEIKYFLSFYACLASLGGYVGVDGLFVGFCLHLASHYQILRERISGLNGQISKRADAIDGTGKLRNQDKELDAEIISIVDRHVELINLTQRVSHIFRMVVFVHFFASAIVIGMTSINFLLANWTAKVLFMNYMSGALVHAYLYAATGDYIAQSTMEISNAVYELNWYECSPRTQRSFLMIIARSQRGLGMKVPFFDTDLSTFTNIVKTAGSYITLMNTFLFN